MREEAGWRQKTKQRQRVTLKGRMKPTGVAEKRTGIEGPRWSERNSVDGVKVLPG